MDVHGLRTLMRQSADGTLEPWMAEAQKWSIRTPYGSHCVPA